jgi:Ca2+-binding RTX toxin-like protein
MNLNVDRSSDYTGNWTLNMGDGNDSFNSAKLKNADSIDMGAGDDSVSVMLTGSNGTPSISAANLNKLDGGTGNDTLSFEESTPATDTELTLTTAGATNFENLSGGSNAEVLKGDNNANILNGKGGADTLYGYGGNDTLNAGSGSTNDILYGGAGNDTLVGTDGDNTLDGGTGADTITSGGGVDTFVIRVGSGGTAITDADTFKDFTDGTDLIGLDNGLTFGDLTIEQGTGDYSSHTIIKAGSEYLAIVENMTASDLTESSFTPVDINESGHMVASFFFGTALSNSSLDVDFSNIGELPDGGITTGSEDISLDGLIDLEVGDKIEFNNEELLEPWVEDPSKTNPTIPQVEEPMSHFIEDRYEDELLFVSLEI